ncbi:hypothetical protein KSP40_PGU016077 [Platanthera guangdongensis]|uniref:Uncharacterized protein n=1 Tax=Platanthera guangdongensis TaxID=2320717 RepID=A0ABR2M5P2_9ASPA
MIGPVDVFDQKTCGILAARPVPASNRLFRHIIHKNNDNKPATSKQRHPTQEEEDEVHKFLEKRIHILSILVPHKTDQSGTEGPPPPAAGSRIFPFIFFFIELTYENTSGSISAKVMPVFDALPSNSNPATTVPPHKLICPRMLVQLTGHKELPSPTRQYPHIGSALAHRSSNSSQTPILNSILIAIVGQEGFASCSSTAAPGHCRCTEPKLPPNPPTTERPTIDPLVEDDMFPRRTSLPTFVGRKTSTPLPLTLLPPAALKYPLHEVQKLPPAFDRPHCITCNSSRSEVLKQTTIRRPLGKQRRSCDEQ